MQVRVRRRVPAEHVRDGRDGADVQRDVLAGAPVPARRGADQPALLVQQRDGQPVDLQLAQVVQRARPPRGRGAAGPPRWRCPRRRTRCRARASAPRGSTEANSVENVPPTRCVGESGVRSPGCSSSSASARAAARRTPCPTTPGRRGCSTRTGPRRSGPPARSTGAGPRRGSPGRRTRSRARGVVDLFAHGPIMACAAHTASAPRVRSRGGTSPARATARRSSTPHTSAPPTARTAPGRRTAGRRGCDDDRRRLAGDVERADALRRDDGVADRDAAASGRDRLQARVESSLRGGQGGHADAGEADDEQHQADDRRAGRDEQRGAARAHARTVRSHAQDSARSATIRAARTSPASTARASSGLPVAGGVAGQQDDVAQPRRRQPDGPPRADEQVGLPGRRRDRRTARTPAGAARARTRARPRRPRRPSPSPARRAR